MATYNKPGVYVEETLSPSTPIVSDSSQTAAVFIGATDRGPTTVVGSNVVGVPTLVTSWSDFINKFSYGSSSDIFSATASTTSADMRYAIYNFFQNNGNQAYVTRAVNTDATSGAVVLYAAATTPQSVTTTVTASTVASGISITMTTGIPGLTASSVVSLSGLTGTAAVANKTWSLASFTNTASFVVNATGTALTNAFTTQQASILAVGYVATTSSNVRGLVVTAKDAGLWSQNLFVSAVPSSNVNYFDLLVYYKNSVTSPSAITDSNRVDRFPNLSLDPTDAQYAPNKVSSNWISVTASNTTATQGTVLMPTFLSNADASLTSAPVNVGNNTAATAPNTTWAAASVTASNGSTAPTIGTITQQLDALVAPIIINYPNTTATTVIDGLSSYSATRGDSFVIVDGAQTKVVATAIATAAAYNTTNGTYNGVYYPWITISDPASKSGGTKDSPPGSAVMAIFTQTDAQRGVFKAPAGNAAQVKSAVNLYYTLTNTDFDTISASATQLNVIRYVPGAGFCVMGARTLSTSLADNYVPVRRTLGYLKRNLINITFPFVFEPNNSFLWAQAASTVESFLYSFWQKGGLFGATPAQAYYVKCDATTNTSAAIAAGELRIEVGVALNRPAEFVVIKIGQFQGGTNITTSV